MALVSYSIPSLWNGVSQQPASLRNITQAEEQINGLATIAEGLAKRPPTQHVAQLTATDITSAFTHTINRDTTERFEVIIIDDDLEVYDLLDGSSVSVSFPDGKLYLNTTDAQAGFAAVTIADSTFIANKQITVADDGTTSSATLTGTVQEFSDLPVSPSNGQIYRIQGQANNEFDDYYVVYTSATGVWTETIGPSVTDTFDASTMPHELVYNGSTFTFQEITWDSQLIGDADSVPFPSINGLTISDIFFHRDRLCLLADENIMMSRSGDYFNLFPTTVTAVTDDDPIDRAASHTKVSDLKHGVPFNESLLLFSDQTQFVLSASGTLTPRTVRLDVSTEFESSPKAKPVGAGQNVYFAVPRGDSTQMREYFVEPNTTTNDAANITAHTPTYLPKDVFKIAASTNEDIVICLSSDTQNKAYVYKYFWSGDQKVQSSWSTWTFDAGDEILNVDIIEDTIYWVIQRSGDGVYLEKMQLTGDPVEASLGIVVHLDRRTELTGSYSAGTDLTTWTIPYVDAGDFQVVLSEDWTERAGEIITTSHPTTTTITASGDLSADTAYVGRIYSLEYTFSEQFVRETRGQEKGAILNGTFMLRSMLIRYVDAGYFRVEVTPYARDTNTYPMSAKFLGDASTIIGTINNATGTHEAFLLDQSTGITIKIINDSYHPSQLMSADVQGEYVIRSKRV